MGLLDLFKKGPSLAEMVAKKAIVVDVRTKKEFASGAVPGSKNIPMDQLHIALSDLDKDKAIIVCCASGIRSGMAKRILKTSGFTEVVNGGSWSQVAKHTHP